MEIKITDEIKIGGNNPVFIIAEVGNNHDGNIDLALDSISQAYKAGADAVSFQYAPLDSYCIKDMHDDKRVAFLKRCEFTLDELRQLREKARSYGLAFSVNVEDAVTLDKVMDIGIDFIKLCSADLTNIPFIKHCASKNKAVFFSTGAAYLDEIKVAYDAMEEAGLKDFVIYHTNSGYPTEVKDANLLQMDLLHETFGGVKGYCDHTVDIVPPVVAAARGAKVVEKHITTDRTLKGDDWMVSLEPDEFALMVKNIRQAEASLGTREKKPMKCEQGTREFKRKSIVTLREIKKGQVISEKDLNYKIPGTGISPVDCNKVSGKKAVCDIPEDVLILPDMIEGWE